MPPEQDKHSKTEQASSQKLKKSREQGQVAKSQDLSGTIALVMGIMMFGFMIPHISESFNRILTTTMVDFNFSMVAPIGFNMIMINIFKEFVILALPIVSVIWLSAFIATSAQVGFHFSTKPIEPSIEKIDPIKGFQRLFSAKGLVTTLLSVFKMLFIAGIASTVLWNSRNTMYLIHLSDISSTLDKSAAMIIELTMKSCLTLIVMAIIDYAYQKWQFLEDQKMTKHEVKQEYKEQEGNPEIKSKVRSMQRATAQKRGLKQAVSEADVVIVNPFHIAVAIKYEREGGTTAPVVVAKGARLLAQRIKEFAKEAEIDIIQNIPLARALYKEVKAGWEIPAELYVAVAEILAIVFKKRDRRSR